MEGGFIYVNSTQKNNKSVLWIEMYDILDKLGVKNMPDLTITEFEDIYNTKSLTKNKIKKCKRYGKSFIDGLVGIYIRESFALRILMNCQVPTAVEFITKLGLKYHDVVMTKEQSVLTKAKKLFTREKILLQL